MPRKYLRRIMPSVDKVREIKVFGMFGDTLFQLCVQNAHLLFGFTAFRDLPDQLDIGRFQLSGPRQHAVFKLSIKSLRFFVELGIVQGDSRAATKLFG